MKIKKYISLFFMLMILVSSVSVCALAGDEGAEEADSAEAGSEFVVNDFECTYYNNDGRIVFNNYGTVYNNGNCGVVYNNGGMVYNNGGTVYNNCGTVYNNSGTVFNNCGEVVNGPDGIVVDNTEPFVIEEEADEVTEEKEIVPDAETAEAEPTETGETEEGEIIPTPEETAAPVNDGRYAVSLAADYSRFAYIEGPDKTGLDYSMTEEDEIIVTPKPGFSLLNSFATTGHCTLQEDGSIVFGGAERDGVLTLMFRADEPVLVPEFGTYGEAVSVKIIAADGVTVYYTTDGSPVSEESSVYNEPIKIETSSNLAVMAAAEGAENSRVFSGNYLIPIIKVPRFEEMKKGYDPIEPQMILVENTGLERLKIERVILTGIDANCFILNTEEGARIEPGQNSGDTWTVAPASALNTGSYEAAVEFTFADGNTASVDLSFTVTK